MLLRFRVANHASLRDEQELSLIADRRREARAETPVPRSELRTVPVAAIYGANASGKSNVIDAIGWMRYAVAWSFQHWDPSGGVPRRPFEFRVGDGTSPTELDIDFVTNGVRYQYGFSCDDDRVLTEWLYDYPQGKVRRLFERDAEEPIKFGRGLTGRRKVIAELLRPNSLYLSVAAAQGHPLLSGIRKWFLYGIKMATDVDFSARLKFTIDRYLTNQDTDGEEVLMPLLKLADLGVSALEIDPEVETEVDIESEQHRKLSRSSGGERVSRGKGLLHRVRALHQTKNGEFSLPLSEESNGTKTWIGLLGPVFTTLAHGSTLCVDELDARLHPELAAVLVGLFQDPEVNAHNAQLIFSSHETSLLGKNSHVKLNRDQVWFTEKDHHSGATTLFPLTDFQERDSASLEKRYLVGRFGALPFLDEDARARLAAEIRKHRNLSETAEEPQT